MIQVYLANLISELASSSRLLKQKVCFNPFKFCFSPPFEVFLLGLDGGGKLGELTRISKILGSQSNSDLIVKFGNRKSLMTLNVQLRDAL